MICFLCTYRIFFFDFYHERLKRERERSSQKVIRDFNWTENDDKQRALI
jgi:hypothetical protein